KEESLQRRLDDEVRYSRCISSHFCKPESNTIVRLQIERENIQIHSNTIWYNICTKSVHKNYNSGPDAIIFTRNSDESRIHNEQEKMLNDTLQTTGVFRVHNRYKVIRNKVTKRENKEDMEKIRSLLKINMISTRKLAFVIRLLNTTTE
ncbi:17153_t:CDS:2, partial [Racocetra persica]